MIDINPPSTPNYPQRGTTPGSTTGPNPLQDRVNAQTVNLAFQDLDNANAFNLALVLGVTQAPPAKQPLSLSSNSDGNTHLSGVVRSQQVSDATHLAALTRIGGASNPPLEGDQAYCVSTKMDYHYAVGGAALYGGADGYYIVASTVSGRTGDAWISTIAQQRGTDLTVAGPANGVAALDGDGLIPQAEIPQPNAQLSSSCGTGYSNNSTSFTDISVANGAANNLAVTIVTHGRSIMFFCTSDDSATTITPGWQVDTASSIANISGIVRVHITGDAPANTFTAYGTVGLGVTSAPTAMSILDAPIVLTGVFAAAAGSYTITVQARAGQANATVRATSMILVAFEL